MKSEDRREGRRVGEVEQEEKEKKAEEGWQWERRDAA